MPADQDDPVNAMATRYFRQRRNPFLDELLNAARSGRLPSEDPNPDEATGALHLVPDVRRDLDQAEVALIESVLDHGWTWEQLGAQYGDRSKQAMQQHYRRRGGKRSWPAKDREQPETETATGTPGRIGTADLDPADVANVREAITLLLKTAHNVAETHTVDGVWTALTLDVDSDHLPDEMSAIGLDPLPRLEVACRKASKAFTTMAHSAYERREPGWNARYRKLWSVRLEDEMQDLTAWLDPVLGGWPIPKSDLPIKPGTKTVSHADHHEVAESDVEAVQKSIALTLSRLEAHQAVFDQVIDELRRRQAELEEIATAQ